MIFEIAYIVNAAPFSHGFINKKKDSLPFKNEPFLYPSVEQHVGIKLRRRLPLYAVVCAEQPLLQSPDGMAVAHLRHEFVRLARTFLQQRPGAHYPVLQHRILYLESVLLVHAEPELHHSRVNLVHHTVYHRFILRRLLHRVALYIFIFH